MTEDKGEEFPVSASIIQLLTQPCVCVCMFCMCAFAYTSAHLCECTCVCVCLIYLRSMFQVCVWVYVQVCVFNGGLQAVQTCILPTLPAVLSLWRSGGSLSAVLRLWTTYSHMYVTHILHLHHRNRTRICFLLNSTSIQVPMEYIVVWQLFNIVVRQTIMHVTEGVQTTRAVIF